MNHSDVEPSEEQVEVARRISLYLVGESPEECARALPTIATFLARREAALRGRVDALTHSLAVEIRGEHSEECDCTDHRRDAERLLGSIGTAGDYLSGLYVVSELREQVTGEKERADRAERRVIRLEAALEMTRKWIFQESKYWESPPNSIIKYIEEALGKETT